jgi:hypothetical protein
LALKIAEAAMRKELLVGLMLLCLCSVSRAQSVVTASDNGISNQSLGSVSALDQSSVLPINSSIYLKESSALIPEPEPLGHGENDLTGNALEKPHPQFELRSPFTQKTGTAEETRISDDPNLLPYKYGPSAKSFWTMWGLAGGAVVANTELYERYNIGMYRPAIPRGALYTVGIGTLIAAIALSEPRLRHEPHENNYKMFAGAIAAIYSGFGLGAVIRRSH